MARKKKVIHWSKLPRAKLVSMVKRLQADKTKLQLQLAQARETKLLNEGLADARGSGAIVKREASGAYEVADREQLANALDEMLERRAAYVVKDNSALDEMLEHGVVHIKQDDQAYLGPELGVVNVAPGPFPWEKE